MFDKIREIVADKLNISEDEITMDSAFLEDLNADSLDIVELIMALEDELDMEMEKIDKDEAEDFIGHDVKKCYYGIEEDDDVLMSIIWAEFDDEYEATAYFKS